MPSKRESSASVDNVPALCTHRPSLLPIGCAGEMFGSWEGLFSSPSREVHYTLPARGRRSRNKVSVGEPAEGSLNLIVYTPEPNPALTGKTLSSSLGWLLGPHSWGSSSNSDWTWPNHTHKTPN